MSSSFSSTSLQTFLGTALATASPAELYTMTDSFIDQAGAPETSAEMQNVVLTAEAVSSIGSIKFGQDWADYVTQKEQGGQFATKPLHTATKEQRQRVQG